MGGEKLHRYATVQKGFAIVHSPGEGVAHPFTPKPWMYAYLFTYVIPYLLTIYYTYLFIILTGLIPYV